MYFNGIVNLIADLVEKERFARNSPKIAEFVSPPSNTPVFTITTYPESIDIYAIYGYQALQAAVEAVKKSCSATNREAFRDALAQTSINAIGGPVKFDNPRDKPLGENRHGSIIVNRVTGRESADYELIKQ